MSGQVTSSAAPTLPLGNVAITITPTVGSQTLTTTSQASFNPNNENYDFIDPISQLYIIPSGTWQLTAKRAGFYDYTHPELISVDPGLDTNVPRFSLDPLPVD